MRRWLPASFILAAACALDPGDPWGVAQISLDAVYDIPADRLANGRHKTAKSYEVALDTAQVQVGAVALALTAGETLSFDPANPPAGYSLCHNGHCHAADGRLVDYEDIELELAGGAGGGASFTQVGLSGPVALGAVPQAISLENCGDCTLEQGALSSFSVSLSRVVLRGQVFDPLGRLAQPRPFDIQLDDLLLVRRVEGKIGNEAPLGLAVAGRISLPAALFDGVDWVTTATSGEDNQVRTAVVAAWQDAGLSVEVRRFTP